MQLELPLEVVSKHDTSGVFAKNVSGLPGLSSYAELVTRGLPEKSLTVVKSEKFPVPESDVSAVPPPTVAPSIR